MSSLFDAAEEAGTYEPPPRAAYPTRRMAGVRSVPENGRTYVSTFSGMGMSSFGLAYAGWRGVYAVEFIPAAAAAYRLNFPSAYVDERDIREIKGSEILDRVGLLQGELDLLEGSPPCSSFSSAGSGSKTRERACGACHGRGTVAAGLGGVTKLCEDCSGSGRLAGESKSYSDSKQRTDDLFLEYVRLVDELSPKTFLAENVPGLIRGDAKEYAYHVTTLLGGLGYQVSARILNAANYGAATERERLIFLGLRSDLA